MRVVLILTFLLALTSCGDSGPTINDLPGIGADTSGGGDTTGGTGGDTSACTPQCDGKQCGPNGCGGFCGACTAGTACTAAGICQAPPGCKAQCDGKACGPDGCGGTCGLCPAGKSCNGAGLCSDGTRGCLPKCDGKACGDDGCGNVCGKCAAGQQCTDGVCSTDTSACGAVTETGECQQGGEIAMTCKGGKLLAVVCDPAKGFVCGFNEAKNKYDCLKAGCTPNCGDKNCGTDGCGGQCGQCKPDEQCNANGQCEIDGSCTPSCTGKTCGPDGCGGQCGICDAGDTCQNGTCVDPSGCAPACTGKTCGPDGCGGSCGTCKPGESCNAGQCKLVACTPNCVGRDCGDDGCGGSCGKCASQQVCDLAGHCVLPGDGQCAGLTYEGRCVGNGKIVEWCENGVPKTQDCTALGDNLVCTWIENQETYYCADVCAASCSAKECGPKGEGCSGDCGTCPGGETCNGDGLCIPTGGGGDCGTVTFIGECEGQTLKYCASGVLETVGCGEFGKTCGFDPEFSWYSCIDPDGCVPNCLLDSGDPNSPTPKECGDDGCGNLCGLCGAGTSCQSGLCVQGSGDCGDLTIVGECSGNTLRYCVDGVTSEIDCSVSEKTCGFDAAANAGEGWYDCLAGASTSCADLPALGQCSANETLTTCNGGTPTSTTCSGATPECLWTGNAFACAAKPTGCSACTSTQRCQADGTCGCDNIDIVGQCEGKTLVYCIENELVTQECDGACGPVDGIFICQ